jgi:hypothetical protein
MKMLPVLLLLTVQFTSEADAQWRRCFYDGWGNYICRGDGNQPGPYPYQGRWGGREGPAVREEWRYPQGWDWRSGFRGRIRPGCYPYCYRDW